MLTHIMRMAIHSQDMCLTPNSTATIKHHGKHHARHKDLCYRQTHNKVMTVMACTTSCANCTLPYMTRPQNQHFKKETHQLRTMRTDRLWPPLLLLLMLPCCGSCRFCTCCCSAKLLLRSFSATMPFMPSTRPMARSPLGV